MPAASQSNFHKNTPFEQAPEIKPLLSEIDYFFKRKDYRRVTEVFRRVMEKRPGAILSGGKIPLAYYYQKKYPEAIYHLERSFRREDPTDEKYILLANCYREMGDLDNAGKYYLKAHKSPEALFQAGLLFWQQGEEKVALQCFYDVICKDPFHTEAMFRIAEIFLYGDNPDFDEAEYYGMRALKYADRLGNNCVSANPEVYFLLLNIYKVQKKAFKTMFLLDLDGRNKGIIQQKFPGIYSAMLECYKTSSCFVLSDYADPEIVGNIEKVSETPDINLIRFRNISSYFDLNDLFENEQAIGLVIA